MLSRLPWKKDVREEGPSYAEIPTPHMLEEYVALVDDTVNWTRDSLERKDWQSVDYDDKRVAVFTAVGEPSPSGPWDVRVKLGGNVVSVMSVTTLPVPAAVAYEKMDDISFQTRKNFEDDLISAEVVAQVGNDLTVHTSKYKAPFFLSKREFVVLYGKREVEGTFYLVHTSINYAGARHDPSCTRGVTRVGHTITPSVNNPSQECVIRRIVQLDPKGAVPSSAVMLKQKDDAKRMTKIKDAFDQGLREYQEAQQLNSATTSAMGTAQQRHDADAGAQVWADVDGGSVVVCSSAASGDRTTARDLHGGGSQSQSQPQSTKED
ncbi:hypothetical protein Pelo_15154 [Pelomyxa schiedti]|nr:hypothetical protein Pelo_15154 [Pelomyxa schiedti]